MLRIFSKSNELSCNDYIKNIKGKTILSNLKTNNFNNRNVNIDDNKIISYLSYNDFLVITQTFYKFSNLKKKYKPPQKIIDLKTSFLFYNKILNHIQNCDFCKMNNIETFFKNCKEIKNILYPYGEHFTYEIYANLTSVDLDYWCRKECINNIHCEGNFNESDRNEINNNYSSNNEEESIYSDNSVASFFLNNSVESIYSDNSVASIYSDNQTASISSNNSVASISSNNSVASISSNNSVASIYSDNQTASIYSDNQTASISSNNSVASIYSDNSVASIYSDNSVASIYYDNSVASIYSDNSVASIYSDNSVASIYSDNQTASISSNNSVASIYSDNSSNHLSSNSSIKQEKYLQQSSKYSNYIPNIFKELDFSEESIISSNYETSIIHNKSSCNSLVSDSVNINIEDTTIEDTTIEDTTIEDTTIEDTTIEDTTNKLTHNNNNKINYVTNSLLKDNNKNTFNIFIAEITNSKDYTYDKKDLHIDFENENKFYNVYNFIPIYLNFDEFKNIFFNSMTKYFNISDVISEKIKLSNQHFKNINNKIEPFIISNSIKKIYIEKNNYNEMNANTLIEIEKETNDYISLYNFNYITNSLNLDEILNIINKNNIEANYEIKIKIKVYYKSIKTDIPCIMYFNYIVQNIN